MSGGVGWRAVAWRQAGAITHAQLLAAGLTRDQVDLRARSGALERVSQGTYVVGGAPRSPSTRRWAAVLATNGVLGYGSAAELWNMLERAPSDDRVHVVVPHRRRVAIPSGVRVHRVPLPDNARREIAGLPVSSPAWTALDHLGSLRGATAATFFDRAVQQGWIHPADVYARLNDWRGRIGNTQLRRLATTLGDRAAAESERRLHRILRSGGLTGWRANYVVRCGNQPVAEVDVAFPERRLAIEVDGMAFHVDAERFRGDRTRQNQLVLLGWTVLRFTWADLTERPAYVLAVVRQALAA